jgi:5-methylcytosine-specific restriction endonuclease McrA
MNTEFLFDTLADGDLIAEAKRLADHERKTTAALIACLMELDVRRLYLQEGCSSLFTYCTRVLHLSEHAAYGRIEAARAARRLPMILEMLVSGDLTLTAVGLLAQHLTAENHTVVLREARHKSKREVEQIVARLQPRPDAPVMVRKLPSVLLPPPSVSPPVKLDERGPAEGERVDKHSTDVPPVAVKPIALRPSTVTPTAPEHFKVQLTISRETYDKLRRVQDLLRHSIPNGDPAAVFDRALTVLLREVERAKLARVDRPHRDRMAGTRSRQVPAGVRRTVWARDGGRCAFVGTAGRCTETGCLEFHHVVPYAVGGATTVGNLELRCRAHNQYEAALVFGRRTPQPVVREATP